jgi:hypothetical protein
MGSLALLMTLGLRSDLIIGLHEGAVLLFTLVVLYLAPLIWVVLLCIRRFRLSPAVHLAQIGVYMIGWLLTFGAGIWLEYQDLPGWFLD